MQVALARSVAEAAEYAAAKSLAEEGAPALVRFIINTIFIDHSQDMAKGHFTLRRLEKIYGKEIIKAPYEELIKPDPS